MNWDKYKRRKWRLWFRVIHRDMGYLIFGLTLIYSISGISLNHIDHWNPSYNLIEKEITVKEELRTLNAEKLIKEIAPELEYKKGINREDGSLRIFVKGGTVDLNSKKEIARVEVLKRRALLYEFNFLHYNRDKLWLWFSDVFALVLIIVSITGLFLVKGKYGITRYGLIWTLAGIIIPLTFLTMVL